MVFNRVTKGARSYDPLFCTIPQTGQVFDHHRSSNVHDSNGAREFIAHCVGQLRATRPDAVRECRMDSACFSAELVTQAGVLGAPAAAPLPSHYGEAATQGTSPTGRSPNQQN